MNLIATLVLYLFSHSSGYLLTSFLHEKPVYGLSVSPQNDYVFASAGEDGRILIYDIREPATGCNWFLH